MDRQTELPIFDTLPPTNPTNPTNWFDRMIEGLLIIQLLFMPLAFGVVEAWSEQVIIALTGIMALVFAAKLVWDPQTSLVWSWLYLPIALFILLAVIQLYPLPAGWVEILSPQTAATKSRLLSDLPDGAQWLQRLTLSFYPRATGHDLRLILVVSAIFILVVNIYRQPEQIKRLLTAITLIAGGIALLALAQNLFGNGKIYWVVPAYDKAFSGTFINHSHYGQFINLSLGAALGLLLVKLHEIFQGREVNPLTIATRLNDPQLHLVWCCVAVIILGAASMFVSLTRGGMVAMLIAGGFTAVVLAFKRSLQGRGWIIATMALLSFICVLYIGFDAVYNRLATLRDLHEAEGGRWQIVQNIAVAWTKFPLAGTGLGTHDVVYPMFDRATISSLASHAENEYAQVAEEMGIWGLIMVILFATGIWHSYLRIVRSVRLPIRSAAFGLGFGLLAIMIHSLSDFGQHLPANACLTAISCGLLVVLAQMAENPGDSGSNPTNPTIPTIPTIPTNPTANPSLLPRRRSHRHGLWVPVLIAVAFIVGWAFLEANAARCAEGQWQKTLRQEKDMIEKDWLGSNEDYTELLSSAQTASLYDPANIQYRHWLNVYRWRSISRVTDPNTGMLVLTPQTLEFTDQIVNELHQARPLCPTFGPTYCVAGQLEYFILEKPQLGAEHIRTGFQLAPYDATTCFTAGLLDAQEGKLDDSIAKFTRAVELDGQLFRAVVDVYLYQITRPDLAVSLAGNDYGRLGYVAGQLSQMDENQQMAGQARTEITRILQEKCAQPDAPAGVLAALGYLCLKEKDFTMAAECFRRALDLEYSQVQWRLAMAQTLVELNQMDEAIHEARICLRLRPQLTAAKKLIEELSVKGN